ncbi:MAG: Biotin carboxylase [Verrucomicrobia bacterium ADurb.Bin474]|nr:MAG: Biotin carboxylase [Verrucomicrobia bacterium ADurb.Bin474]
MIPPYYDSMIAKIIAVGENRSKAIERLDRALGECIVRGIKTNTAFVRSVIGDPVFREGKATTRFIADFMERTKSSS